MYFKNRSNFRSLFVSVHEKSESNLARICHLIEVATNLAATQQQQWQ